MGSNPTWGSSLFSLKRRESELSQVVLLCCLALFIMSPLFNHVPCVHADRAQVLCVGAYVYMEVLACGTHTNAHGMSTKLCLV